MTATLTCRSCLHSRYAGDGARLYCSVHRGPCVRRCPDFDYAPGSDEFA